MIGFEVSTKALNGLSLRAEHYRKQAHCDNCAGPLPVAYFAAIVHHEDVICCSGRCLDTLYRVWAPSKRTYPFVALLLCLCCMVLSSWH